MDSFPTPKSTGYSDPSLPVWHRPWPSQPGLVANVTILAAQKLSPLAVDWQCRTPSLEVRGARETINGSSQDIPNQQVSQVQLLNVFST